MAQETDVQLSSRSLVIRNETVEGGNTRQRHDDMNQALIDSKINNDKIDTDNALATSGKTVPGRDAVKAYIAAQISAIVGHFKGVFASEAALDIAFPTADEGDYALVDTAGPDAQLFIWDDTDADWVASGITTIVPDATDAIKGIVELSTPAEDITGTDAVR